MTRPRMALLLAPILLLASTTIFAAPDGIRIPDAYATSATKITLGDGRALNLRCAGKGERVVLFEAGTNADSSAWFRVLPLLAGTARACAYDRAGYGFSDAGPMPRDLEADVADLHELIRAARLPLPLVLVGHSLGSNIVRQYAIRHPHDVAGMLLVDPPEQGEEAAMPAQWKREDAALREKRDAFLVACEQSAQAGALMPGCLRAAPPWMGARVAAAVSANKSRPDYWRTLHSELSANQRLFAEPVPDDERYGDIPLILLAADTPYDGVADDVRAALEQARAQTRQRILAASTTSRRIDVPGASHDIQLDRPEAVASAVRELLRQP